jgi:hypothetical protein
MVKRVSSRPVADLAGSLADVAGSLQGLIKENLRASAGSPASQDAVSKDMDGDWVLGQDGRFSLPCS